MVTKLQNVILKKMFFDPFLLWEKFKSKISYLDEKNSILPWQMAEQLAVEVDVKNVTDGTRTEDGTRTSSFIC